MLKIFSILVSRSLNLLIILKKLLKPKRLLKQVMEAHLEAFRLLLLLMAKIKLLNV
ncbi:Uncharacterised protein [Vibrio cholerae]|nr:Uncharacterised protein [Vibrio cholerae]